MTDQISNKLIVAGFAFIDQSLPVFTSSAWEDHVQAWFTAEREVTERRWQQAAICASIVTHYGEGAIQEFAASVGCHYQRVYEYRRAYELATRFSDRPENLEFTHFVVASSSPNAEKLIEQAAEQSLTTRQLRRLVSEESAPAIDASLPAISHDPHVAILWGAYVAAGSALAAAVPLTATAISYANEEVRYILELPEQTVQERILQTISQGYTEADAIAKAINQDRDRVFVWLSRLVEQGVLTIREQTLEERAPGARGPARHYYEIA